MRAKSAVLLACMILLSAAPVFAHHSVSMYDMAHPTTVTGTVTKLDWTNPHGYIYVDVKNAQGQIEHWSIEIDSPNFLKHNGWTSTTVKPGDIITCTGGRAKSRAMTMRCTIVKLSTGEELRS
jgi:DNA/RNA endonuclease YhcR with UshA esterase domain